MKLAISTLLFALAVSLATTSSAQMKPLEVITYDSLAMDSTKIPQNVENAESVKGFANNSNVALVTSNDFVIGQFYHGGAAPVEFQVGSKIEFYWTRNTNDSSKVWFVLRHYIVTPNGWINLDGPGDTAFRTQAATSLPQQYSMTVKNAGYNTVEIWQDTTPNTKPVYIDAIVLVQHGTLDSVTGGGAEVNAPLAKAAGFSAFPNPFLATEGTTLHPLTSDEHATYVVMDMLGREVRSVVTSGDARITLPSTGTYFIRKKVGSEWSGAPLRISAE